MFYVEKKKATALKSTTAWLKPKTYGNPECSAEAQVILEIYINYLINENLSQESNITYFGEIILYHNKEFEIHKNSHNMNIFILKSHYV